MESKSEKGDLAGGSNQSCASEQQYFSVRVDGRVWSKDPISVAEFEKRGFTVSDSRSIGDKDVFADGQKVATLFITKGDAAKHIRVGG